MLDRRELIQSLSAGVVAAISVGKLESASEIPSEIKTDLSLEKFIGIQRISANTGLVYYLQTSRGEGLSTDISISVNKCVVTSQRLGTFDEIRDASIRYILSKATDSRVRFCDSNLLSRYGNGVALRTRRGQANILIGNESGLTQVDYSKFPQLHNASVISINSHHFNEPFVLLGYRGNHYLDTSFILAIDSIVDGVVSGQMVDVGVRSAWSRII